MTDGPRVPGVARLLGYAGLLPQLAALVLLLADPVVNRFPALVAGFAYAAIILSFLGGTWWGLAARAAEPPRWVWFAAVAPSLVALAATLVQFVLLPAPPIGVPLLGAALLASPLVDRALARCGLAPDGWLGLRVPLSVSLGLLTLALAAL